MTDDRIVVIGNPWTFFPGGGSGGGSNGSDNAYNTTGIGDGGRPPGPADLWRMSGRMDCNNLKEGFNSVVYALSSTPTGRKLIDSAYHNSAFRVNLVMYDSNDPETRPSYNYQNKTLTFDPFVYGQGVNPDGTSWVQSPIVIFAHELAHQMLGPSQHSQVIALTNRVVTELRSSYPIGRSTTNRISEIGQLLTTGGVSGTSFSLHPPCN